MAARKRTKKTASKKVTVTLPKGFTAIESGGFASSWPNDDTKAGDSIQGIVIGYKTIPTKYDKKPDSENVCTIETKDSGTVDVWKSAGNGGLFEDDFTDCEVFIGFEGYGKAKRNQSAPKLFKLAFKG